MVESAHGFNIGFGVGGCRVFFFSIQEKSLNLRVKTGKRQFYVINSLYH